jgi:alcohol dehydrogenase
MKALVFNGPRQIELCDAPEPVAADGEALLRVEAAGICGSDMRGYHGQDSLRVPPLIMGHEVAGSVLEGALAGRRAIVNPQVTCRRCDACLSGRANLCRQRHAIGVHCSGGFADLLAVPESNLIAIPDDMDPVSAALAEPAATCLHALVLAGRVSGRPLGEARALVLGAGAIGFLSALWLRSFGARALTVADTNPLRRETVADEGFTALDPSGETADADAYDLVVDAVGGGATRRAALAAVRPGGVILHVGMLDNSGELDMRRLTMAEITLIGCYTYLPHDLEQSVRALYGGALGALQWLETRPLADGALAFAALSQGAIAAPKVVLRP